MPHKKILAALSLILAMVGLLITFSEQLTRNIIELTGRLLQQSLDYHFWSIGLSHAGVELILLAAISISFILFYDKKRATVLIAASLACICLFLYYILRDSVNIPFHDDYFFLEFLNNYSSTPRSADIFMQDNESRLIFMKLLSILLYYMHAFNFKTLVIIANLCLVGSAAILYRSIQLKSDQKLLLGLALTVGIFQFQYYDSEVWASGALYSSCTLFFSFLSIGLMHSQRRYAFWASLVTAIVSVSICGAGFLILSIGSIVFVSQKKIKESIVWISASVICVLLYFNNYSSVYGNYSTTIAPDLIAEKIISCFPFSCTFLGGSAQFFYQIYIPFLLGLSVWAFLFFLTYKKYYSKHPSIYLMLLFICLSSLIPPLLRNDFDVSQALHVHYGIYSVMALSCCLIALMEIIKEPAQMPCLKIILPLTVAFHLMTGVFFYPEVVLRKEQLIQMAHDFNKTGKATMPPPYSKYVPERAVYLFNSCADKNIYHLPE